MTKQEIITIIVTGLISSFAKSIFDKIFGIYIPDKKKLISYAKNFLVFACLYLIPIAQIIYLMIKPEAVDKYFVFGIAFNFCVLLMNFYHYLYSPDKVIENIAAFLKQQDKFNSLHEEFLGDQSSINKTLTEYSNEIRKHITLNEIRIDRLESEIKRLSKQ